jgi:hypothetical protein
VCDLNFDRPSPRADWREGFSRDAAQNAGADVLGRKADIVVLKRTAREFAVRRVDFLHLNAARKTGATPVYTPNKHPHCRTNPPLRAVLAQASPFQPVRPPRKGRRHDTVDRLTL